MKINLIIGAGQLGSRHLQGMLKWEGNQEVYVVDPFDESLKTAEIRANEIEHNHKVIFTNNLSNVPQKLDLVIIATQANVREKIIFDLVSNHHVENFILEKVLFQEIEAFYRVDKLLDGKNVWVNHPRRMFEFYKKLKNQDFLNVENKIFSVFGVNWGLACNALHFINIITFLANSKVKSVNTDWLDQEILESKRNGFIEFTGTLKGELENGDKFIISSKQGEITPVTININYLQNQLVIVESSSQKSELFPSVDNCPIKLEMFQVKFQSELTKEICEKIFSNEELSLPTYKESMDEHIKFIEAGLSFYNNLNKTTTNILPIT
jgi:hypothetical protein